MDEQIEFNPKRRLCPDGTCTGIIASDGRCSECRRAAGESSATAATTQRVDESAFGATADDGAATALESPSDEVAGTGESASGAASSTFDPNRRLCDDGSCVGVIGPSGSCTVCGRRAS